MRIVEELVAPAALAVVNRDIGLRSADAGLLAFHALARASDARQDVGRVALRDEAPSC